MARILIAEDEAHIMRVLSLWLSRHGYEVLEATDGIRALAIARNSEVDLIISDMNMPGLTGLELVRAVREQHGLNVPVLLLSARCDQDELARQARRFNTDLYPKPFVPSRLVAEIERLLCAPAR